MALNFPTDTSNPYIDVSSGLKYIFNPTVGAWESAIQPPVIISDAPPEDVRIPGYLYWDKQEGNLYIYYRDEDSGQWIQAVPNPEVPRTFISSTPPSPAVAGDLWWDESTGRLYVYYTEIFLEDGVTPDPNPSSQWVDASPASVIPDRAPVTVSTLPPANPLIGNLWWNRSDGNLYVWYEDVDGGEQWVVTSASIGIGSSGQLKEVTGALPVEINTTTNGPDRPIVSIRLATQTDTGVLRFGTQLDVNNATSNAVALAPGTLKNGIKNYVPDATFTVEGTQRNATQAEVDAGLLDNVTVTPETLANSTLISGVPPGAIIMWGSSTVPVGWVECDGRDSSPYPNLIPYYPDNIPDLRGEFVRGWDNTKGVDSGRALGSFQGQQIQAHFHTVPTQNNAATSGAGQSVPNGSGIATVNTGQTGGTETRPRNIALMYIIKT
ncbi:hypothetical protein SCRM01_011 [Synechococcus phage S-CRM01]|uniref:tail collar fiber protein n=1 Tax=Synechococcus phage S-CRM01 TaxID=1026955 RepID=UPI000209E335|nr:tail collar fiber protein [Synechococcus phage S-CRM01]AEC52959.1 hypothetical protein SCRM01_011 [Synechococcus phage S-CRM01]